VKYVPVVSKTGKPLMPCSNYRANELVRKGKAFRRFKSGLFYIKLTEREDGEVQPIAIGIDPGSKREAFTVKSESHTYLNILADAVTWVKEAVERKRNARKARRQRKTPCRKKRINRARSSIPPSTKARWQLKLRIVNKLRNIFPITDYVVEDIKAETKGKRKWDVSFSPLEVGKKWFYGELRKLGKVELKEGWWTFEERNTYGLKKTKSKMSESFDAHNVDSWVLANWKVGGHTKPDNTKITRIIPLQFHRRQLHRFEPSVRGIRKRYGGTMSLGFKKGSIVKHKKYGICYIGGNWKDKLSLHSLKNGKRLTQKAKTEDVKFLSYNSFREGA
jgi:hypothetical protein